MQSGEAVYNAEPQSFKEAIEFGKARQSLSDTGINGFKEITDINEISFGHFIIIEKLLAKESSDDEKIKMLAPYLVRPLAEDRLDNDNPKKESEHLEKIQSIDIGAIYGTFNRFIKLRHDYLYKTYNGVIYGTLDDSIDDTDDEDEGTVTNSGVGAREGYEQKWFWYNLIGAVADGNIFRRQAAVELPMYEVMPFLAERRHKQIVENLEAKARR